MPLQVVERGLYVMSKGVKGMRGRTWAEYGEALRATGGREEPVGTDGEADVVEDPPPRERDVDPVNVEDGCGLAVLAHHSLWVEILLVIAFSMAFTSASIQVW